MPDPRDPFSYLNEDDVPLPHGWIQWKGTNVCMDVHCVCGALGHVDADFCYFIRCVNCGRTYGVGGNVRLYELPADADLSKCCEPRESYDSDLPIAGV